MSKTFGMALALSVALAAPAFAGDYASINQQDSYTYTQVIQHNGHTKLKVKELDERSYERLSRGLQRLKPGFYTAIGRFMGCRSHSGASNSASIEQAGYNNAATATQSGSNDFVSLRQDGDGNIISAHQLGNDQTALANQTGSHNIAFIMQSCR